MEMVAGETLPATGLSEHFWNCKTEKDGWSSSGGSITSTSVPEPKIVALMKTAALRGATSRSSTSFVHAGGFDAGRLTGMWTAPSCGKI